MGRRAWTSLLAVVIYASSLSLQAAAPSAPPQGSGATRVKACSLLTKEEVKQHLPWNSVVDFMAPEEEAVGAAGSSCNYASVFIQIFPVARKGTGQPSTEPGWQPVSGVGEEAYFRANGRQYAELYVRTSRHTVTLQANASPTVDAVKPGTISLANALLAKLR